MSALTFLRTVCGMMGCLALLALPSGAVAAKTASLQSSAATLTGSLTVAGVSLKLSAVAAASGSTLTGPYATETDVPSLGQVIYVPSQSNPLLGISVQATSIAASASGSASSTPFATASVAFSAAGIALLPPASTGGSAYLSIMITNASTSTSFMPATGASGNATLGSVVVTGTLLKGKTYTAPLNAAANTVLLNKDGVKATVNAQSAVKPLGCGQNCASLPQGQETDAVKISVSNLTIDGQAVSGSLEIGQAIAN